MRGTKFNHLLLINMLHQKVVCLVYVLIISKKQRSKPNNNLDLPTKPHLQNSTSLLLHNKEISLHDTLATMLPYITVNTLRELQTKFIFEDPEMFSSYWNVLKAF